MNTVILIGRIGQDPEMKYFESGKVKTVLSIAVNRWIKKEEKTDWFRIELWDKNAEFAGEYVKKGRQVAIEGTLDINKWTDSEGNKREYFFIRATDIRLLGGKNEQAAA
jgi:single-strand DNA-binding protein